MKYDKGLTVLFKQPPTEILGFEVKGSLFSKQSKGRGFPVKNYVLIKGNFVVERQGLGLQRNFPHCPQNSSTLLKQ